MPRLLALIQDLGDIAGLISFLAMTALLVLYVVRARELRRLRRTAPFLTDTANGRPGRARSRRAAARVRRRRPSAR
ncbi:MAG: hypothetical protein ACJ75Z_13065 [Solirubrobacterales bacterium]